MVHLKHRIVRFKLLASPVASARVLYIYKHPHYHCTDFTKRTESWCVDLLTEVGKWRCFVPSAHGGNMNSV